MTTSLILDSNSTSVNELRKIADRLNHTELVAVLAMWGLRSMQEAVIDMVNDGGYTPQSTPNTAAGLTECTVDMLADVFNDGDFQESIRLNKLAGDYVVEFKQQYVATKKV